MSVDYAIANTANAYIQGGLEISTSVSGGNVTVTAKLYMRRTNVYSGSTYDSNLSRSITIDGSTTSGSGAVTVAGGQQNVWQGPILTASKTFTGAARNITISWAASGASVTHFNGSGSTGYTVPAGYIAPSGGYITILSKTHDSVTAKVGVSSFGTPSTNASLILKILEKAYVAGVPTRENTGLANGATTTVTNDSAQYIDNSVTISGNKKFYTGLYASNGALDYRYQGPTFITPCPPLVSLTFYSQSYISYDRVNVSLEYTRQDDGGELERNFYFRYSTDGGSSYSNWEVSSSSATDISGHIAIPQLPTSKAIVLQVKLVTTAGDSEISTTEFTTLSTHQAPDFVDFDYHDSNEETVLLTGDNQSFIQGQSIPVVEIPASKKATGNDSIAISGYNITFSGSNYLMDYSESNSVSKTILPPSLGGNIALNVTAVDGLGLGTMVSKNTTVYPWYAPTVSASIERENGFENNSTLKISGAYAPIVVNGETKNALVVRFRCKKSSSSDWGAWETLPAITNDEEWVTADFIKSLDNSSQWDVEVEVADKFATDRVSLILPMGIPKFFIGVDGRVSVGERPEKSLPDDNNGQLEVAGDIYAKDVYSHGVKLGLAAATHVGQVIMSTTLSTADQVAEVYGGTWVEWGAGRVPVGLSLEDSDFNAVNKTGGDKAVTLTVAQMPSHTHEQFVGANNGNWGVRRDYSADGNCAAYTQGNTGGAGGNQAHPNLQPYVTCYMWLRTT